jgi:hypothetical protein
MRINLKSKKIVGYNDSFFNWSGDININNDKIFISNTPDSNEKIFKIGNLSIDKSGEVYYGE